MRRFFAAGAGVLVVVMATACDPCTGVRGCGEPPMPAVEGRLVTWLTGHGVANGTITLIRWTGGVGDSVTVTTDDDGLFSAVIAKPSVPGERLSLRVKSAAWPGYTVDSLPCRDPFRAGDACVLAPIIEMPRLPIYRFLSRIDGVTGLGGVDVVFRRTGGGGFTNPAHDSVLSHTTPDGFAALWPADAFASSAQPIIGDLSVEVAGQWSVQRDFKVRPSYWFVDTVGFIASGPTVRYWLVFVDSLTNQRLPGVEASFKKVSGIPVRFDSIGHKSDANGILELMPVALSAGTLSGTLRLRPRPSLGFVDLGVIDLPTFDADTAIVYAKWLVGAQGAMYPLPREGKP